MSVMLGFQDEEVKAKDLVDWSSNKFGGFPNWMIDTKKVNLQPKCKKCGKELYLVVQIYCPLVNSFYHRTLYVFGCTEKYCWNHPESFSVFRCQKKVKEQQAKETTIETDDWGTNEWVMENESETKDENIENTKTIEEEEPALEVIIEKMSHSLNISNKGARDTLPQCFVSYHVYVMEEKATAKESQSNDYEMQLYQDYVRREGIDTNENSNNINSNNNKTKAKGSSNTNEKYEKTTVKHGDRTFYQFSKRLRPCPQQCLRYHWKGEPLVFSSCSKTTPPLDSIPDCPKCGSQRVFEMQLMPHLVTCLRKAEGVRGKDGDVVLNSNSNEGDEVIPWSEHARLGMFIDFGCLYVFTCTNSCWDDADDAICSEIVAMQPDPETSILS